MQKQLTGLKNFMFKDESIKFSTKDITPKNNWVFVDCTSSENEEEERFKLKRKAVSPKNSNFTFQEIHFRIPTNKPSQDKRKMDLSNTETPKRKKQRLLKSEQQYTTNMAPTQPVNTPTFASVLSQHPTTVAVVPSTLHQSWREPSEKPLITFDDNRSMSDNMDALDFAIMEDIESWISFMA